MYRYNHIQINIQCQTVAKASFWPSLVASGLVREATSPRKSQFPHP